MNPYPQGPGYPQQPFYHNIGFNNQAPQSFVSPSAPQNIGFAVGGNSGFPSSGYPSSNPSPYPSSGYPQTQLSGGYPQARPSTYASESTPAVYPPSTPGYPSQTGSYPSQHIGYPSQPGGYPSSGGYSQPHATLEYPQTQSNTSGYPSQQSGYPSQPSHGYGAPQSAGPTQTQQPKTKPTVVPVNPFNPLEDAEKLRKAMKGFGTDEKTIIQVLTRRSNEQRLRIAFEFKTLYGKDLVSDLKSETSGKFEDVLVALMTPLPQFYAKELHDAIAGIGTDEDVLIEVMCSLANHEINVIKQAYTAMYGSLLEDDLRGDTSGHFKRLMTSLCMGNRNEDFRVDQEAARNDARSLLRAGELRLGTDESVFNAILCSRSFSQLSAIFQEYHFLTGHDIDDAIKNEFSGDLEKALRAIVKIVRNKPLFFAEHLHKSMKGIGTNDRQLIRIMVTRCEIDLGDIRDMFQSKYGKSLESWIEGDCSGHYKKCLLGLLGLY